MARYKYTAKWDELFTYLPVKQTRHWKDDRSMHLLDGLFPDDAPLCALEEPVPLVRVMESNGVCDALMVLRDRHDAIKPLRLMACDLSEHVVHLYENEHQGDNRVRNAVMVARSYANNCASEKELLSARKEADDACRESVDERASVGLHYNDIRYVRHAARSAVLAASPEYTFFAAHTAEAALHASALYAFWFVVYLSGVTKGHKGEEQIRKAVDAAEEAEKKYQTERFIHYFGGEQ